VSVFSN